MAIHPLISQKKPPLQFRLQDILGSCFQTFTKVAEAFSAHILCLFMEEFAKLSGKFLCLWAHVF